MRTALDSVQTKELSDRATARFALAVSADTFIAENTLDELRARGFARYTKDAGVILSTDTGVAEAGLNAAFLAAADRESILGQLDGAIRMPLSAGVRVQLGTVTAAVAPEGEEKPIAKIDFTFDASLPAKIPAAIVVSDEALRVLGLGVQSAIAQHLISAVAAATDVSLVAALTAGSPPAAAADAGALLMAVSGGAPRRPALIGSLDTFLSLPSGQLRDLRDLGVAIVPTPAAAGFLIALDQSGLLVADVSLAIDVARHASIQLDTGSPAAALVSLWQTNLVAIRAERFVRFVLRSDAVSFASVGSPV
jgi:hypothetical protein